VADPQVADRLAALVDGEVQPLAVEDALDVVGRRS
jgi:hypothetical protein